MIWVLPILRGQTVFSDEKPYVKIKRHVVHDFYAYNDLQLWAACEAQQHMTQLITPRHTATSMRTAEFCQANSSRNWISVLLQDELLSKIQAETKHQIETMKQLNIKFWNSVNGK